MQFIVQHFSSRKSSAPSTEVQMKRREELMVISEGVDYLLDTIKSPIEDCERLQREHEQMITRVNNNIEQANEDKKIFNKGNEICVHCIQSQTDAMKDLEDIKQLATSTNIFPLDMDGSRTFGFQLDSQDMNLPFSFDSPTFRTSTFGYVFKLRVCSTPRSTLHKQDYLSIYLSLYSSAYDPILVYPFPYNISLYLRDQSGERRDIEATIRADVHSLAFACPTGEKNDEVGVSEFCPLDYLTKSGSIYLKDGVFFIRVLFHFMDAPSVPIT